MMKNSVQGPQMKSDENLFFCQIYAIFGGNMVHIVIDRHFSLFLKGLKIFLNSEAITDSPFNLNSTGHIYICHYIFIVVDFQSIFFPFFFFLFKSDVH